MTDKKLFRSVALERLSSPDQLDLLMEVTTPKAWIALVGFVGILIAAIIWGITGSIPTKISSPGILISGSGLADITAPASGQITTIYVEKDDVVTKGQVIARIDQTDLIVQISANREELASLLSQQKIIGSISEQSKSLRQSSSEQQREMLSKQISDTMDTINILQERIVDQEKILKEGLITKQTVLDSKEELKRLESNIDQYNSQLKELDIKTVSTDRDEVRQKFSLQQQIEQLERDILALEDKLDSESKVLSPFTGRVIEISSTIGDQVLIGSSILSLEQLGNDISDLQAVLYVSPMDGKKIQAGMTVQLAPSTVKLEEYGFMEGVVTSVSDFPATTQGMMQLLKNEKLVAMFSSNAAPIPVIASIIPAPNTISGYKWSSREGPPVTISSGTICSGSITVRTQRPITLVIPTLKKILGLS